MQIEKNYNESKDGYLISKDPSLLYFDVIYNYLSGESYWAKNIQRGVV